MNKKTREYGKDELRKSEKVNIRVTRREKEVLSAIAKFNNTTISVAVRQIINKELGLDAY